MKHSTNIKLLYPGWDDLMLSKQNPSLVLKFSGPFKELTLTILKVVSQEVTLKN